MRPATSGRPPDLIMPITGYTLPQVTAQFAVSLRARALATRIVNRSMDPAPVQLGDTLNIRFALPQAAQPVTPGHLPVAAQTPQSTNVPLVIDRFFERSMVLTDKDVGEIEAGAPPQQVTQMGIDLAEQVNSDVYAAMVVQAGSAVGTAGTNPFQTDEGPLLDALQRLEEARAAAAGRVAVLRPDAWRRAIQVPNLVQADRRGGGGNPLVTGELDASYGAPLAVDQLIPRTTTNAIGAGAITVNGVNAAGATSLSLAKGAGANWSARAGDVLTIAGQPQPIVLAADIVVAQGSNTLVQITAPLPVATVGGEAVTVVGAGTTYSNNLVFHRDAVLFASRRLQELTVDGRNPADTYTYTDDVTGLVYRAEIQRQHYQSALRISCLYGVRVVRPQLVQRLLG